MSPPHEERPPDEGGALKTGDETDTSTVLQVADNVAQAAVSPYLLAILDRFTDHAPRALDDAAEAITQVEIMLSGEVTASDIEDAMAYAVEAARHLNDLRIGLAGWSV